MIRWAPGSIPGLRNVDLFVDLGSQHYDDGGYYGVCMSHSVNFKSLTDAVSILAIEHCFITMRT